MKARKCCIQYKDHGIVKNKVWSSEGQIESGKRKLVSLQKATQQIVILGFAGSLSIGHSILSAVNEVTQS